MAHTFPHGVLLQTTRKTQEEGLGKFRDSQAQPLDVEVRPLLITDCLVPETRVQGWITWTSVISYGDQDRQHLY
jgi:hypothetical protein